MTSVLSTKQYYDSQIYGAGPWEANHGVSWMPRVSIPPARIIEWKAKMAPFRNGASDAGSHPVLA